jgi:hypothetical protein
MTVNLEIVNKHFKSGFRQMRFDKERKWGGLNGHTATRTNRYWAALVGKRGALGTNPRQAPFHSTTKAASNASRSVNGRSSRKAAAAHLACSSIFPEWCHRGEVEQCAGQNTLDDGHVVFEENKVDDELEMINRELNFLNQQILAARDSKLLDEEADFFILNEEQSDDDMAEFVEIFSSANTEVDEEEETAGWSLL